MVELPLDFFLPVCYTQSMELPYLPTNIKELLPTENNPSFKSLFVAIGPSLIDRLAAGEDFVEICNSLRINPDDAIRLLQAPEFLSYIEAYLSLGDITDKHTRIRLVKSLLAAQIASGAPSSKRRDALDYIAHIQKELSSSDRETNVFVQVNNTSVPRPYLKNTNTKEAEIKKLD
jgi:hypothetical protein